MKTRASSNGITQLSRKDFKTMMQNGRFSYAIMAYSDIHFHDHPRNKNYKQEVSSFVYSAVKEFCNLTKSETKSTPFSVMFLGDYYDNPAPRPDDIEVGYDLLKKIMTVCNKSNNFNGYFEISGNHVKRDYGVNDIGTVLSNIYNDRSEKTIADNSEHNIFILNNLHSYSRNHKDLEFISKARNSYIYVQDDRTEIKINLNGVGSIILKFLCYNEKNIRDPQNFSTEYKEDAIANIALFHLPIQNAWYDTGVMATSGANLPKDYFDDFNITLGGDYHTPQTVQYFNSPVMYVGAPAQFHFGHKFIPIVRYIGMKVNDDDVEFYCCNVEAKHLKRVSRRFLSIDASDLDELIGIFETQMNLIETKANDDDQFTNGVTITSLYTIRITGNSNQLNKGKYDNIMDLVKCINEYFRTKEFKKNAVSSGSNLSYEMGHVIIDDTKVIISKNSVENKNDSRSISEVLESHRNIRGDLLVSDLTKFIDNRFSTSIGDISTPEGKKANRIFQYAKQHILEGGKS